eukprot:gene5285-6578_t
MEEIFDNQNFFDSVPGLVEKYYNLESDLGCNSIEQPAMRKLLPKLNGLNILDLGCGNGWFIRESIELNGANSGTGVDISKSMIKEAIKNNDMFKQQTNFVVSDLEEFQYPTNCFDLVVSSYVMPYIKDYEYVVRKVNQSLKKGGKFIFSFMHPIYLAGCELGYYKNKNGKIESWPIRGYHNESSRAEPFLDQTCVLYHRTMETYVNSLLQNGFKLDHLGEPKPILELLKPHQSELYESAIMRPAVLILAATKI